MKIIMHLDMDSYFASAERTIDPSLMGKPIVISSGGRRSIATAVSYEAKALGVKTAMPLYKAKELAPNLIQVRPHFHLYINLSGKVFEYLASKYSSLIEVGSIDEVYMDVTNLINKNMPAKKLAKIIQEDIKKTFKLPVSIGISTNKFVAKMSTGVNKPYGITLIREEEYLKMFKDWPIDDFFGVGKALAPKLRAIGIRTIGDLANANAITLNPVLGSMSQSYIDHANGRGSDIIETKHNELKSIGNEVTFMDRDRSSLEEIYEVLSNLSKIVSVRATNRNLVGEVVSVHYNDARPKGISKRHGKQKRLKVPIQNYEDIFRNVKRLFNEIWDEEPVKLLGVGISSLKSIFTTTFQSSIFDKERKKSKTQEIVSKVNAKLKDRGVYLAKEEVLRRNNKEKFQNKYIESDKILKHYDKK